MLVECQADFPHSASLIETWPQLKKECAPEDDDDDPVQQLLRFRRLCSSRLVRVVIPGCNEFDRTQADSTSHAQQDAVEGNAATNFNLTLTYHAGLALQEDPATLEPIRKRRVAFILGPRGDLFPDLDRVIGIK